MRLNGILKIIFDFNLKTTFSRELNSIEEFIFKIIKNYLFLSKSFSKIFKSKFTQNLVCFGSMMGQGFVDNSKYLFLYLIKNPKYQCYWFTSSREVYKTLKEMGYPVIYNYSFKAIKYLKSAGYIITAWGLDSDFLPIKFSPKSIIIQTWHGSQFKKLLADIGFPPKEVNEYKNYYLISPGKVMNQYLITAFQINPEKILVTGLPRNDILFQADETFKLNLKNKYRISKEIEKIILYAPTFRSQELIAKLPLSETDFKELNNFLIENKYLLLCKSHFWNERELFKTSKNIKILNKFIDTQELILISDILITDYSSIFFDFILMKKPVLLFPYDLDKYLKYPGIYHDLNEIKVGPIVKTGKELVKTLKLMPEWIKKCNERILQIREKYWDFYDANSCKRFFHEIFKLNYEIK